MSENKNQFEKLSFWQLLENRTVEIPIIQRDYAQGRKKQVKVRNTFLDALYNALFSNPVELDFVYGSEENGVLQPLDGQQRLSTLFLLHWYIANKEDKLTEAQERLSKFTYETRTSSREFCTELIDKSINHHQLLPINEKKGITSENQFSETIKNSSWFVYSWRKDPTISAMLTMLDAINKRFPDICGLWNKLTSTENPPITFLYVKLKNFGLSDDLYIKMNARGKQLTPFENFKSRFEKHIETNKWEEGVKLDEKFSFKIDTIWTDLFWLYKNKIEKINENGNISIEYEIDSRLTNFIAGIAINNYAQSLEISENKEENVKIIEELINKSKTKSFTEDSVKRERIERRMTVLFNNPNDINPNDFSTKESFEYLVNCLNIYSLNDYAELKIDIDLWNKYYTDTLFKDIIQNEKTGWQSRTMFYAQTIYLLTTHYEDNAFKDWIRVIRNIVENSSIDSASSFIAAINLIKELSKNCTNIYYGLYRNHIDSGFAREQVQEEIEKAKIIEGLPDAKQIIHKTEDTNFCKGKIDFALYCADYDTENPNPRIFNKDNLKKICDVIIQHLSENDVSNDFRLAFLTIKNNDFYDYWGGSMWSWEFNRRRLLEDTDDFKKYFALRGKSNANINNNNWSYSKELLNQLTLININTIIDNFKNSINFQNNPLWIQTIFKKPELLNCSNKHYFVYTNEGDCYLIKGWRTSVQTDNWDGLEEIK
ncbi:MAG: DUF262 domain-containing protein [Bacteroidales bacterium]|nr:DUF262 domain-containing protein [Bacteroidales bacterium]